MSSDIHIPDPIIFDFSTFSTFESCKEKARLTYVEGLDLPDENKAAHFGTAIHRALEVYHTSRSIDDMERSIVHTLREYPLSIDNDERRSIERAVSLVHAYVERWKGDFLETVHHPLTQKPILEHSFMFELCKWRGRVVWVAGKIDRLAQSVTTGHYVGVETKTTTSGLGSYLGHTRPNHQLSIYSLAIERILGFKLYGMLWDAIYISDRKPDPRKGGWFLYGIDIEKDFGREQTVRTETDYEELLYDMETSAKHYLDLRASGARRWTRNAPAACYQYGGCKFLNACRFNLNENVMRTYYVERRWSPLDTKPVQEGIQNGEQV